MAKEEISDFGGLITTLTPNLLELGEATKAEFCDVTDGVLESAFGRRLATTMTGEITTIYDWRFDHGGSIIVVFTTDNIYSVVVSFSGAVATSILPGGGYTIQGTRAWSIAPVPLVDKIVCTNSVDPPLEWDGVTATMTLFTLPSGVEKPHFVVWWKNRLHLFAVTQDAIFRPYRQWWSKIAEYNQWNTTEGAGFLDYTGGNEPFTGVADLENFICIFKQNRIVLVTSTGIQGNPFANREIDNIRGTYAPFSIQVTDRGVFYLAVDGLRLFTGTDSVLVSAHVDAFSAIPITVLENASSVIDPIFQRYFVTFPSVAGEENDIVWVALYQFYPKERVEFTSRTYTTNRIRSLGRIIRSQAMTWEDFRLTETWEETTIAWNDAQTVGEFDELMAGGYSGQFWFFENTASDLDLPVLMNWTSGVLPREIGLKKTRLLGLTVSVVPSVGSELIVEVVDAESGATRYSTMIDLSDTLKRTYALYPNRSFDGGFFVRLRNNHVNSLITVSQVRYWTIEGADFRR